MIEHVSHVQMCRCLEKEIHPGQLRWMRSSRKAAFQERVPLRRYLCQEDTGWFCAGFRVSGRPRW